MNTKLVTRESLQALIASADVNKQARIIGRALVVLFERQTASEQATNDTNINNRIGFAACDARGGSLTAKYFIKHGTLLEWQLNRWLKLSKNGFYRITKYAEQLNDAATQKAKRNSAC